MSGNSNGSNVAAFGAPKSLVGRRTRGTNNNKLVYPCRVEGWLNIYGKRFILKYIRTRACGRRYERTSAAIGLV